jgi:hypothetical protein
VQMTLQKRYCFSRSFDEHQVSRWNFSGAYFTTVADAFAGTFYLFHWGIWGRGEKRNTRKKEASMRERLSITGWQFRSNSVQNDSAETVLFFRKRHMDEHQVSRWNFQVPVTMVWTCVCRHFFFLLLSLGRVHEDMRREMHARKRRASEYEDYCWILNSEASSMYLLNL